MSSNLVYQPGCSAGKLEYLINCVIREDIMVSTGISKMALNIFAYLRPIQMWQLALQINSLPDCGISL